MAVNIRDLISPARMVDMGEGKSVAVRGITLNETIELMQQYHEPLSAFYGSKNLDFALLIASAPDMACRIIAMATNTVGQEEDIKFMSLMQQIDIITEVWDRSVPNVKKLFASLEKVSSSLAVAQPVSLPLSTTLSPLSSTDSLAVATD